MTKQQHPGKALEAQPEVREWESQGHTDDEKWAVQNFLTGAGKRMIERLLKDNDERWVEKMRRMIRD